jgi:hypothetical protein
MAIVAIHAGFDPGKSSSVIEKQLRIFPATTGLSYASFFGAVANSCWIPMLLAT